MIAIPRKTLDALEKGGAKIKSRSRDVKAAKTPPRSEDKDKDKINASLEAFAVTNKRLSEASQEMITKLDAATVNIIAANVKRAPVPYRFDIARDKNGVMKSITATPLRRSE